MQPVPTFGRCSAWQGENDGRVQRENGKPIDRIGPPHAPLPRQHPISIVLQEDSMTGPVRRNIRSWLVWRNLRWALAAATVPFLLWACNSHPLEQPKPAPEQQTDLLYEVNPLRQLDLVF